MHQRGWAERASVQLNFEILLWSRIRRARGGLSKLDCKFREYFRASRFPGVCYFYSFIYLSTELSSGLALARLQTTGPLSLIPLLGTCPPTPKRLFNITVSREFSRFFSPFLVTCWFIPTSQQRTMKTSLVNPTLQSL